MKKTKRFLSAALAAAVFGMSSAYVAFADDPVALGAPTSLAGNLTFTEDSANGIYGATMTEAQLKSLEFSGTGADVGRDGPGYFPRFYVEALDPDKGDAEFEFGYTYVENLNPETIKRLTYHSSSEISGNVDGTFWIRYTKSLLTPTGKDDKPFLVYSVKAKQGTGDDEVTKYYYVAVKWADLPEDFKFDGTGCTETHFEYPCEICGNCGGNYLKLKMSGGAAEVNFRDGNAFCRYPEVYGKTRFAIPVGCSGSITIKREGEVITSVKIGSSTEKRDCVKVTDTEYSFTVQEGDTEFEVLFESDATDNSSESESSAPSEPASTAPTRPEPEPYEPDNYEEPTTHESAPEADTNPDTGIALAAAPAVLASAAVLAASKKRK